jgi:hypothetical protein
VRTFRELMEETDWDKYGTGNYEKCADCMAHCGYEATAVSDAIKRPWKMAKLALKGFKTEGAMAPEIPLAEARKSEYVFGTIVEREVEKLKNEPARRLA